MSDSNGRPMIESHSASTTSWLTAHLKFNQRNFNNRTKGKNNAIRQDQNEVTVVMAIDLAGEAGLEPTYVFVTGKLLYHRSNSCR